jgi:hypothetical protein
VRLTLALDDNFSLEGKADEVEEGEDAVTQG